MYGSPSIRTARRRGRPRRVAIVALAALLGWAARASAAIVITGGPSYAPGGGASCLLGGNAKLTGGATWTCTGPTAGTFSNLYIGIRNDQAANLPIGESMDGTSITGTEIFAWSSNGANTIVYTGQTTVVSATACTRLTLTFTGGGSIVDDATTQALSNVNGAVHALWHTTVTGPATFTVNALIEAKDPPCTSGTWTPADEYYGTTTIHGKNTTAGAQDLSHVDIGFYTSTCGDTTTDTNFGAEQCDEGGANGLTTSCCTSTCQNRGAGQVCRTSTGECDPQETCTGSSGACPANAFSPAGTACTDTSPPSSGNCKDAQCNGAGVCDQNFANETNGTSCDDSLFCNGTDSCNAGSCSTHSGDPCPGPDGDGNCSESCDESTDTCTAPDPNGSACSDGLFCNGTDSCSAGACTVHSGDPCPGPDGDGNCAESCNEGADNCTANDPDGSGCAGNGSGECSGADTCSAGVCNNNDVAAATPCGDTSPPSSGNCKKAECNGSGTCDQNFANESNGTSCNDSLFCNGTDSCNAGACSTHSGDPCPGPDGDGNCSESCNEASDDCTAPDPNGSSCTDGLFCNGTDTCSSGSCTVHTGDPCPGPDGDANCKESCDEAADNCLADDPNGSACDDGLFCDGTDTCSSGTCTTHTGDPCPGPDGDTNCSESCDETANNCLGADPDGTLCRPATGDCDLQETCSSGACPADDFQPSGTACGNPSDTECDNPDTCDGSNNCLANLEPSGFACGDPSDTTCTDPDTCDGAGTCEPNNAPNTVVCRPAAMGQACDAVELCDGAGNCPADGVLPSGTLCRGAVGVCDLAEDCDGSSSACPPDQFKSASTPCRADTGECDVGEFCTGSGPNCPPDGFEPPGTACGDPSNTDCDNPDTCDGSNNCLPNLEPAGTACPDDGETCTADECNGSGTCTHPASNAGTVCRPAAMGQLCDAVETCDGSSTTCPPDGVKPAGTVCRPDAGDCDMEEQCDGISSACPADVVEPSGTACGDPSDTDCTNPDTCDGLGACQPNNEPNTVVCRAASAGLACDAAENCDGAGNCPADVGLPNGTPCRASAGVCDLAETCDGTASDCPADAKSTAPCRASMGVCDPAEVCDGVGNNCPADAKSTSVCRPALNPICDVAESCDGINNNCPADVITPNGTSCTDGLFCNGAETCQAGACAAGTQPCALFCEESTDTCETCASAPLSGCRTADKSLLLLKNGSPDDKDRLVWKWIKGMATSQMEFADPTNTTSYSLCIYSNGTALAGSMGVPPDSTKWQAVSDKGFKYTDLMHSADGAFKIKLKGSTLSKSKALVKGRGGELPDTLDPAALTLPVKVQLVNNDNGICFESNYSMAKTNTQAKFKAKAP